MKNKQKKLNNPVFIGGHRRSGTTMFVTLLDNHPQLCVFPNDSSFFYGYYPLYENKGFDSKQKVQRIIDFCYENLLSYCQQVDPEGQCGIDFEKLYEIFREKANKGNFSSKEIFCSMMSALEDVLCSQGKRWVEKTSSSELYAKEIFSWFPNAQFINLIRDPRDNYASLKSGWEARYKERNSDKRFLLQSMVDRGKLSLESAIVNSNRYGPEKYMLVKFENLVGDIERSMNEIAQFLNIDYHKCLLEPSVIGREWKGNNFKKQKFNKTSKNNVSRWRERITDHEAKVVEYYFRDLMEIFEYEPHFDAFDCADAAIEHYKWYNYAKGYNA